MKIIKFRSEEDEEWISTAEIPVKKAQKECKRLEDFGYIVKIEDGDKFKNTNCKTKELYKHLKELNLKTETMLDIMTAHGQRLEDWKESAMSILSDWDMVWEASGKPGKLGSSKAESVLKYIQYQVKNNK